MASLTGRVFLVPLENDIATYLDFHWDVDFSKYAHLYANASNCYVDINRLTRADLDFCHRSDSTDVTIMRYTDTYDYDVLLLEVNPTLYTTLQRLFPRGNIFHVASTRLFSFSQTVQQAVAEYGDLSGDCIVGVHIRARKRFSREP